LEARGWAEREEVGAKGGGRGKGEVMTQTLYAHVNKRNKKNPQKTKNKTKKPQK
jgi:hypothetical protein